ncbi:MAG: methyltransferase domain-containing protein [Spirochaetaceae bacterium]|nr:methyltransferase domain-containing protein [Spirochaetaceae bacterium]
MSCRLCGEARTRAFAVRSLAYHDCPRCGYIGLAAADMPTREAERARYLLHRNDPADAGYRAFLLAFVEALPGLGPGLRILDYGSGPTPALAALLAERGCLVDAYDPCFAPSTAWRRRSYGLVAVHEVAEHLRFPRRALGALARRLDPGGRLALRTRFAPGDEAAFARWWYREDPTHVGFFRERSFACLAEFLDLELEELAPPDRAVFRRRA